MSVGRLKLFGPRPGTPRSPIVFTSLPSLREDVDLVHVVVDDPDVFLGIVRIHQDLVRPAAHLAEPGAARRRQILVVLQPLLDRVAGADRRRRPGGAGASDRGTALPE